MLHLNNLTMNNKINLSFNAYKTFLAIKRGTFNKEQIKSFENNLFFVKTTNYGQGCFSKFMSLHLYRLIDGIQQLRSKELLRQKLAYINQQLKELNEANDWNYLFSNAFILSNLDYFYKIANMHYKNKEIQEKIDFIKLHLR
ncbi:MAG: hypothetical protein ACQBVK_02740, partial [Candidatus Phytoplasma sp. TWB_XP]